MKNGMIQDKTGRWIGIHDKPGGWKISAFDRDVMFQAFLNFERETPDAARARSQWIAEIAKRYGISPKRVEDLIFEGKGGWGPAMQWWVGCSLEEAK